MLGGCLGQWFVFACLVLVLAFDVGVYLLEFVYSNSVALLGACFLFVMGACFLFVLVCN